MGLTPEELPQLLERMGLLAPGEAFESEELHGGISSDIWLVHRGESSFVVKRARGRLRVKSDWRAPIDRGASEAAWLRFVAEVAPGHSPRVLAVDEDSFAIALEYFDTLKFRNWKEDLLAGRVDEVFASQLGDVLGRIHAASSRVPGLAERFANQELFESLRIEPYLLRVAAEVPEASMALEVVIAGLRGPGRALVHGDFSPKNILIGERPVILDAECATWGDPAFDAAFLLSHLAIKEIHLPNSAGALRQAAVAFEGGYLAAVTWEEPGEIGSRISRILPALVLARVAGASQVEYLSEEQRESLRRGAIDALNSDRRFFDVIDQWEGTTQ